MNRPPARGVAALHPSGSRGPLSIGSNPCSSCPDGAQNPAGNPALQASGPVTIGWGVDSALHWQRALAHFPASSSATGLGITPSPIRLLFSVCDFHMCNHPSCDMDVTRAIPNGHTSSAIDAPTAYYPHACASAVRSAQLLPNFSCRSP